MKSVAIIGSGISGISAAFYLNRQFEVHVFEKSAQAGGHTHTVKVDDGEQQFGVDTAFMVFNRDNYRKLTQMFDELAVTTCSHSGGFNFYDLDNGFQYGTDELSLSESQIQARYSPEFYRIWQQANRFFTEAPRHFFQGETYIPLKDYLAQHGYDQSFLQSYLVQLGSACWSLPYQQMAEMPASTLIGFFMNHGTSGLGGKKVSWETVEHGSQQYLHRIEQQLAHPIRLNSTVQTVYPKGDKVAVVVDGKVELFDYALIATHADHAFRLLEQPTALQRQTLGQIRYNSSEIVLHTDVAVLPADPTRWQSWNYGRCTKNGEIVPFLVYHMNKIHGFEAKKNFLVSVDSPIPIDENKVISRMQMEHPIIDLALYQMQPDLYQLNAESNILFSGTYFSIKRAGPDFAGFHESGISSALDAVNLIKQREGIA